MTHGQEAPELLAFNHEASLIDPNNSSYNCNIFLLQLLRSPPQDVVLQSHAQHSEDEDRWTLDKTDMILNAALDNMQLAAQGSVLNSTCP